MYKQGTKLTLNVKVLQIINLKSAFYCILM